MTDVPTKIISRSNSIRKSILESFQSVATAPSTHLDAKGIKVVPYVNVRQVLGIAALIIWPIILGTAFNIYGFEEASAYLDIRLHVEKYQGRVMKVQALVNTLVAAQKTLLESLLNPVNGAVVNVASDFGEIAKNSLEELNELYPELSANHKRVTPTIMLDKLNVWLAELNNFSEVDPTNLVNNISEVIRGVRMFFSAFHVTNLRGGDTWNNVLQELFISEVVYRLKDLSSFGDYAYRTTNSTTPMKETNRLTLIRRYQRSLMALDLYSKYSLPRYQVNNLLTSCSTCNWTFLRRQKTTFWKDIVPDILTMDHPASLQTILTTTNLPKDTSASVFSTMINANIYPIEVAHTQCELVVKDNFQFDLNISAGVFAVVLAILIGWIILTTNLLGLVAASLAGIFSESYRFQWVQLCRRRAIEREKSRSDKIVAEMFFEMNFKYLYEGNLPPTVLYKEATIAFVELLQYEELCKIYTTVDHIALLDWYYHLVSAAVKTFNTNLVATAGNYCLLACTHAYHAENVALSMLRLMSLTRDSFLPSPHNNRLPLIRAGIHTGPVAGAIVSLKFPLFTMLGDTVNTAARMNSKSKPYCVLLSETTNTKITSNFATRNAGVFNVKGKGQMNTYWLLLCRWTSFAANYIDLDAADNLRKKHDLEAEHDAIAIHDKRRSGFHSLFDNTSGGRRRSSSVNDGSVAGLGGDLFQSFLRSKRRRKSKKVDRSIEKNKVAPMVTADVVDETPTEKAKNGEELVLEIKKLSLKDAPKTKKFVDSGRFSAQIDVKASPNESYYIQVANSVLMRSWKANK